MQKGHLLSFLVNLATSTISFSYFNLKKLHRAIQCEHCKMKYDFTDENLLRQLDKIR